MCVGILKLEMTTDPVELWAANNSVARLQKNYFDANFEPFYRTVHMFIRPVGYEEFEHNGNMFGPVFNKGFLLEVLKLQNQIEHELEVSVEGENYKLFDICNKPMAPDNVNCVIQSLVNFWQNDEQKLMESDVPEHAQKCIGNRYFSECLGTYGGPILPHVALGGFLASDEILSENPNYLKADTLVVTLLIDNFSDNDKLKPALAWEDLFNKFMLNYSHPSMDIAFRSERSIEDELERMGKSDIPTIIVSYVIMFIYIALALGRTDKPSEMIVSTKVTLGLGGVMIVLLSVFAATGLYGLAGVPCTLLIIEVIPFLVLAVGVDNIFILVEAYSTLDKTSLMKSEGAARQRKRCQLIGRAVGDVGPSMLLSSLSQSCCFFLGALSEMPAVRAFALYAGMSLLINFVLQMILFVALFSLDVRREEDNRVDIFCCIKRRKNEEIKGTRSLARFFEENYAPFLMRPVVRALVVVVFLFWFCASVAMVPHIDIGLEEELSMPDDSYVLKYFNYLEKYSCVGPPVYFVLKHGYNFTDYDQQNKICSHLGCNKDSLIIQIKLASQIPNRTFIAVPSSAWIDDYFEWSLAPQCCKQFDNGSFCSREAENRIIYAPEDILPTSLIHEENPENEYDYTYGVPGYEFNANFDAVDHVDTHASDYDDYEYTYGDFSSKLDYAVPAKIHKVPRKIHTVTEKNVFITTLEPLPEVSDNTVKTIEETIINAKSENESEDLATTTPESTAVESTSSIANTEVTSADASNTVPDNTISLPLPKVIIMI